MTSRQPRAVLTVLGQLVECDEVDIHLTRDANMDTLTAKAALFSPNGPNAGFWSSAGNPSVQCMIDDGAGSAAQLFDGKIDSIECDFSAGTVSISARDNAAKSLDTKTSKKILNKKPHEIVSEIMGNSGLSVDADPVGEKAGRTFQIDTVALIHGISDWHVVQQMAEHFGMKGYATGGKVYFKKPDESLPVYSVVFSPPNAAGHAQSNIISLSGRRNCTLGQTITSTVHSWHHKNQKKYTGTATKSGSGGNLNFHFHLPGLDQSQVNSRAKSFLYKATNGELEISIEIPGDPSINARTDLLLSGTGSGWDQLHKTNTVEHKISYGGGYTTKIDTKSQAGGF